MLYSDKQLYRIGKYILVAAFCLYVLPILLYIVLYIFLEVKDTYADFKSFDQTNHRILYNIINPQNSKALVQYRYQRFDSSTYEYIYMLSSNYKQGINSLSLTLAEKNNCGFSVKPTKRTKFLLPLLTRHYVYDIKPPYDSYAKRYAARDSFLVYGSDKNLSIAENFCKNISVVIAYKLNIDTRQNYFLILNPQQNTVKIRVKK